MSTFIDWLSCVLPFGQQLPILDGGAFLVIDQDGKVEKGTTRRMPVPGSWDNRMFVRNASLEQSIRDLYGDGCAPAGLEVSGCPGKFMQGHNLWGPDPYASFGEELGLAIAHTLGLTPTERDRQLWWWGAIRVTMIDITRMYNDPSAPRGWAKTWLRVARQKAHGGHQSVTAAGHDDLPTLYVGQKSRRIALKIYAKEVELAKHPQLLLSRPGLRYLADEYVRDTLRVEIRIHDLELKQRRLDRLGVWTGPIADEIMEERIRKLSLPGSMSMAPSLPPGAPLRLQRAYALWVEGRELRPLFPRATFFRYRRQLLEYGVDIAKTRPRTEGTGETDTLGKPLKDFLKGPGMYPAEWAQDAEWLASTGRQDTAG